MYLTDYEQDMLNGKYGKFKQIALERIVEYARTLGATELCTVSKATLYYGAHPYLNVIDSDDYNEVFSKMHLCTEEVVEIEPFADHCFCQTCSAPCDQYQYEPLHLSKELFERNNRYLEITRDAGVSITGSCTPYQIGWIPLKGEHYVTTESSNVLMCNSVFGAYGNSDGIEAVSWSAICGRTPLSGNHIKKNRIGTVVFNIQCPSETALDWDIIGYTIGRMIPPNEIPVIAGNFKNPNLVKLKQCFASMATTSAVELCHIVDFTPEAPTLEIALGNRPAKLELVLSQEEYDTSLAMLCDKESAPVNFVTLGCPHYTLEELRDVAMYIQGKHIAEGIDFFVWTDYAIKEMAVQNGYDAIIQASGGHIMTSGCPLVIGKECFKHATGFVADSAKQAHYLRSELGAGIPIFFGSMKQCVDAAVTGHWNEVAK